MVAGTFDEIPPETECIGRRVIGCAIEVHRKLGPGYKEPIYVEAFCLELDSEGLKFEREKSVSVFYKNIEVGKHRLDLLIEQLVVIECKAADSLLKLHSRQVTSYLRATNLRLGYVFNFNVDVLNEGGIKRVVL
jgi:GxxExxY protein